MPSSTWHLLTNRLGTGLGPHQFQSGAFWRILVSHQELRNFSQCFSSSPNRLHKILENYLRSRTFHYRNAFSRRQFQEKLSIQPRLKGFGHSTFDQQLTPPRNSWHCRVPFLHRCWGQVQQHPLLDLKLETQLLRQIKFTAPHPLNLVASYLLIDLRQSGYVASRHWSWNTAEDPC